MFRSAGKLLPTPVVLGSALVGAFGFALICKNHIGGEPYDEDVKADGKVAVVTGANTGIGKETAWELARRGAKVYMACRDMKTCEATREEIVLDTKNKYVYCRPCDLASLESIRSFVKLFKRQEDRLDILINNAGVMRTPEGSKTKEGFEMQLGVNHMGHFLLTNLLLDNLRNSAPSRIINLACIDYKKGKINKEDLNRDNMKYNGSAAYSQSKLANVLFTNELAERLAGTGVTVNCVHTGIVDTSLIRHMGIYKSWISTFIVRPMSWPFIKTPKQACQTIIYMALDPKLENETGKYYYDYKEKKLAGEATNKELGKWLWLVSEKWTRLRHE